MRSAILFWVTSFPSEHNLVTVGREPIISLTIKVCLKVSDRKLQVLWVCGHGSLLMYYFGLPQVPLLYVVLTRVDEVWAYSRSLYFVVWKSVHLASNRLHESWSKVINKFVVCHMLCPLKLLYNQINLLSICVFIFVLMETPI